MNTKLELEQALEIKKKLMEQKNKQEQDSKLITKFDYFSKELNECGFELEPKQLKLLLSSLDATGITKSIGHKQEWVLLFLRLCILLKKNPEKKEIYAVCYRDSFSVIISFHEFIKKANKSPNFQGFNCEVITKDAQGKDLPKKDIHAIFTCKPKNWDREFVGIYWYNEWFKSTNAFWSTSERHMLWKTAVKNGLSACFPLELEDFGYVEGEFSHVQEVEQVQEQNLLDIKNALGDKDGEI